MAAWLRAVTLTSTNSADLSVDERWVQMYSKGIQTKPSTRVGLHKQAGAMRRHLNGKLGYHTFLAEKATIT